MNAKHITNPMSSNDKRTTSPFQYLDDPHGAQYEVVHQDEDNAQSQEHEPNMDCVGQAGASRKFWKLWNTDNGRHPHPRDSSSGRYWIPITLRAPVLGSFIVVSVFLIIVLEVLSRLAGVSSDITGSGAIAYAGSDGNLSTFTSFAYLYFPTIIAVCYSMVWSWVDLDSKRLEPWFQLSQEGGASADDSLLLHYNFDFLAVVPIRAARRKHWSVFFAGITMMVIFWAITPLQSAIFGTGSVMRTRSSQMATVAAIQPIEFQTDTLNANFLMTAYGISWLDEQVPEFTTKNYAVRPFAPVQSDLTTSSAETWSTSVEAYSTNLTCTTAKSTPRGGLQYDFDNGKGCFVPGITTLPSSDAENSSYILMYIGYYSDAHIDWALENPNCTRDFSNNFLAIWASSASLTANGTYGNMTALFCETSYSVQNITVRVNASDHSILSDSFGSTESKVLNEGVINTTNFEYVIGTGFSPVTQITDYPNTLLVEQYPRLIEYNLTWPTTNMVGYGVSAASLPPNRLGDPAILRDAFSKAHQLLFSVAVSRLMDNATPPAVQDLRDGLVVDQTNAIILVRVFSVIVEALLLLICFMTVALWYTMFRRKSQLIGDPNSIGQYMGIVASCLRLKTVFRDMGTTTREQLDANLRLNRFRLRALVESKPPSMHLEVLPKENTADITELEVDRFTPRRPECVVAPNRPLELRMFVGFIFISVLALSIFGLAYLNVFMTNNNGFGLPSSSPVVRQILENYLPTILATILEPFWVVLNRLLCILKPFDELRRGKATPSKSIDVKYTSLPPPLVFWRALRSRHFLLSVVCAVSVLANVLAVSLSGLFNEAPTSIITEVSSTYNLSTSFNGVLFNDFKGEVGYSDHLYMTLANVSARTSLPPWVGTDFFFTPFNLDNSTNVDAQFTAITRGFGVDAVCNVMTDTSTGDRVVFKEADNGTSAQFSVLHMAANGTVLTCTALLTEANETTILQQLPGSDANAFEIVTSLKPLESTPGYVIEDNQECESMLIAGWARLGPGHAQDGSNSTNSTIKNRPLESIFLSCQPNLQTALFNITVDRTGRIISTQQQTPFDQDLQPFFKGTTESELANPADFMNNQIRLLRTQFNEHIAKETPIMQWHNTTISSDWLNYLLTFTTNSTTLISPTSALPPPTTIIPAVESLYRQIGATLLGLNQQVFNPAEPTSPVTVTITVPTTRIFMSQIMFLTALTILGLNLIVAVLYYANRPKRFLPMMPTTIASIAGLVVATRALDDYGSDAASSRTAAGKAREDLRYGYGRFVGTDGFTRIGIERHPWVVPLETKNPQAMMARKRTWGSTFGIGNRDEKEPKIWI